MKKSLLLSVAVISAFSMTAQTKIVWDFYSHGIFSKFNDSTNKDYYVDKETDIINAYCDDREENRLINLNKDASLTDPYQNSEGVPNRMVSLFDGRTYAITADPDWKNGTFDNPCKVTPGEEIEPGIFGDAVIEPLGAEYAANLRNNPFICWLEKKPDNKYYGPARVHWYKNYGTTDKWDDKDLNAVDADNWVSDKGAITIQKSKQGKKNVNGTYIQFPEVQGQFKVTYWIACTTNANKYTISAVVNGEIDPANQSKIEENVTPKRYYKKEFNYTGTEKAALRIMSDGPELILYRVEIEPNTQSGIANIAADVEDENAPVYNLMGIQVDETYKGIVIKNGKKYVQR